MAGGAAAGGIGAGGIGAGGGGVGEGEGGASNAGVNAGATDANSVEGGGAGCIGRGAASCGGATTGGGGCGSEMSRSSDGNVNRSVSTGIVASSGMTLPPGWVSLSRSVLLRVLVAILDINRGGLKAAVPIAFETRARLQAVFVLTGYDFDDALIT